jgi:hypothetical protein
VSEREGRALDQFRDERLAKLEEALKDISARESERGIEISQLQQMINGVKATVEQYSQLVDSLKNLPNDLMDALKKSNEAAKLYIDEKLGSTNSAGAITAQTPQSGLGSRLGEKIMGQGGVVDKVVERILSSPIVGGSSTPGVSGEIVDLERQMRNVFELEYRNQMRKVIRNAYHELGIPTAESVKVAVTHGQ